MSRRHSFFARAHALLVLSLLLISRFIAVGQVPVASYDWKPVRVGAGGFVTGMSIHPLDPEVRYARTDVGNGYRWDAAKSEWIPMLIRNVEDGTGLDPLYLGPPVITGVESLQVDPSNLDVVYMSFKLETSDDMIGQYPTSTGALYKSTDRGQNFTRTGLIVPMQPNGATRAWGERIAIDPNNSDVVYYGTVANGLHASFNASTTWAQVATAAGAPAATANVINIVFDRSTTTLVGGQTRSAIVYAAVANGAIFRSTDGGVTWASITTGTTLEGLVRFMTIGPDGKVHAAKGGTKELWQFFNGAWVVRNVGNWGSLTSIAVDMDDPNRIFAISDGGALSRSLNGGHTWVSLSNEYLYANTFAWLPQYANGYRSNGGIYLDSANRLWSPQGNEGVLTYALSPTNAETGTPKVQWTIQSQGIEELVGHDVIIPPGSGDKPIISVHDATAFFIDDPDQFTAKMAQLQDQLISNGIGIAYCPNEPTYLVVFSSDANNTRSGRNYSGYSSDGGRTWTPFGSQPIEFRAGQIAVSRRDGWGLGQDRIVILPSQGRAPKYSHDGGMTWNESTGVPVSEGTDSMSEGGMINFAVRQRLLVSDPFVANKFYLGSLSGNFYVSTDGGITWSPRAATGLAAGRFHSQMDINRAKPNDIWFASGWEGIFASRGVTAANMHGLFRTGDEGTTFQRNPAVQYAICHALGAGSGLPGDANYSVYFYGKLVDDPQWGVFRSTNEGATWTRVAYYPAGIFDWPSMMAASWDTFGLLYVTFNGNTAVYGLPSGSQPPQLVSSLPADILVTVGASATFSVQVTNLPSPTYKWQRQDSGATTWTDIPGATNASYTFTSSLTDTGARFRAVVTNLNGQTTSQAATLTVTLDTPPSFATPPQSQMAEIGASAVFSVNVAGLPAPTLQWQIQPPSGGAWSNLSGATSATYSRVMTLADDGARFRVVATNTMGTATSAEAILTLYPLTSLPSASVTSGTAPLDVSFTGGALGGRFDNTDAPGTATAQGQAGGAASNAFDKNTATDWRDNAPIGANRTSWLQYTYNNGASRTIGSYAITSAAGSGNPNTARNADPYTWALLGSNDNGATWTTLDTRTAQTFTKSQRRVFTIAQPQNFKTYRLRIDRVRNTSATFVYLTELELIRTNPTYTYAWNFDDGTTSSVQDPEKTFAAAGTYAVSLTISDSLGSASTSLIIYVDQLVRPTFMDDRSGTPVRINNLITYTVTFAEDIDAASVQASNFGNAGTSAISIGSISETSPGIFHVPVTATSDGTLQLQINAGASINATGGKPLNTNSAILDDTVLTILPPNRAPLATAQSVTTAEDVARAITLAGTDIDGDTLTYTVVTPPANGLLSGTAPNLTYTPTTNYNGTDSFTFLANDGPLSSTPDTVSITITPVNDAPVVTARSATATEDAAFTGTLVGSATDVDAGTTLTYAKVGGPTWLSVAANGTLSGTPSNSDVGANSFTFSVSDGIAAPVQATLTITVTNTNDAPTWTSNPIIAPNAAEAIAYTASLAGNAVDADAGATLTFAKVSGPAWLSVAANGALSGTPSGTDTGVNSFTVRVSDAIAAPVEATLIITVNPAGLFFNAGTQVATQTTPNVNNLIDLNLAAFTNNTATTLTAYTTTSGQNITGNLTRANLARGELLTTTEFDALLAASQSANVLSGVINFSNPQGTAASNRFSGINGTGAIRFTSDITLTNTNIQTRSFGPAPTFSNTGGNTNSAPISGDGMLNIGSTTLTLGTPVDAIGFTALQRDGTRNYTWSVRLIKLSDSTTQTVTLGGISTAGSPVSMVAGDAQAGNYRYDTFVGYQAPVGYRIDRVTLTGGFMNVDSLAYAIIPADGGADSLAPSLVDITDDGVSGSIPTNTPITYTLTFSEDMNASTVTAADFGNAGSAVVSIGSIAEASPGVFTVTVTPTSSGTLQFMINAGAVLNDNADNSLNTTAALIDDRIITAIPPNTAAVANSQGVTTNEDTALPITLTATDAEGDTLTYTVLSQPANGTLNDTPPNLTFTPAANYNGADSFTFIVNDGSLSSTAATVSITITPVNDAPVVVAQSATATEDTPFTGTLIGSASDVDAGANFTYAKVSGPAWLSVAANGTLSGTPSNRDVGANSFTFSVSDGIAAPVQATLTITVINANDAPTWTSNPILGANATEASAFTGSLAGNAVDVDAGATLTFSKVSGPAWLDVAANGTISGTPSATDTGTNNFTVSVSDGIAAPVQATLNITVNPAGLFFNAGTHVATQTTPNVNNLIDLNLADFTNNQAGQALTAYTATSGQNINGSITRSNLTQGELLTATQFDAIIASSQSANLLSGVINFSAAQGIAANDRFSGFNNTGTQVFTSSIAISNTNILTRTFLSANSVGTGGLNSAPINGAGYFNTTTSTMTLSTPVDAFGFTQLQRDGSRTYTWSVRIVDLTTLATQTISLGGITTAGTPTSMTSGDANAGNYRYDTFVGYRAPAGYRIDRVALTGGFMNVDSLAYAIIPAEGNGDSFADWLLANPPATGFETDSDNDGLSNGIENLLGTDPNAFSQGLTQVSATGTSTTFAHSLSATPASDVTLSYQWSTDLVEWKASGETNTALTTATITPSLPVAGQVTVTAAITTGPSEKIFIRLVATRAE